MAVDRLFDLMNQFRKLGLRISSLLQIGIGT